MRSHRLIHRVHTGLTAMRVHVNPEKVCLKTRFCHSLYVFYDNTVTGNVMEKIVTTKFVN